MMSPIKSVGAAVMIAGLIGSALPASAQTSTSGVNPTLISGDQSPERIAEVCGIDLADIRGEVVLSPPSSTPPPGAFTVGVTVTGDKLAFTDASAPDQFGGTKGVEAVGVRRNGTYVYCYDDTVADSNLDAPGSGTPNQVTFVWGPGPCPFTDAELAPICAAYEGVDPAATEVFVQGHLLGASQPVNICGCPPAEALFCDEGTVGSCIPEGESEAFTGSEFTGSSTTGTGTCEQLTTTVGGRLRTITVCN